MPDLETGPLADFVATYLHEGWEEDFADLDEIVQAYSAEADENDVAALRADIDAAVATYGEATWPTALWPFDEAEAPPVELLTEIYRRLS